MEKWKEIWNKEDRINKIILDSLIKADGFDTGAGSFNVDSWIQYTESLYERLSIQKQHSVFDVGCGSGAFLYPLHIRSNKVGGVDYSYALIKLAKNIFGGKNFDNDDAMNIDVSTQFDVVVAHSVFHYFKDLEYSELVIQKMLKKSASKVAIFDINDEEKKDKYHQVRMGKLSKVEYKQKYEGLDHLFYTKDWFIQVANKLNVSIEIFDQSYEGYANSSLRFNVIMEHK